MPALKQPRRVVVTGLGLISPVGNSVATAWDNLIAGRTGIATITKFDHSALSVHFAGEVKDFNVEEYVSTKEARHMDTFIHYGIAAGTQAIRDSGITITDQNAERIGVMVGSGIGGLPMIEDTNSELLSRGPRRISPFFVPGSIINMISGHLSILLNLKGPNVAAVTACTTGLHSIGLAARLIQYGDADVMLAGGAESTISPLGVGGFAAARALSTRNDDPATASRPWDKDRDGFVLGEGSGCLILEEYEHAIKRGAKIYAEVAGCGATADAYHITAPHPEGLGAKNVMLVALEDAGMRADEIDYINTHGTSTPIGDGAEVKAITQVFGEHAYALNISATKSMTGHCLGAAGVIESIASIMAVVNDIVPPTINHFTDDPDIDPKLNFTFNKAQKRTVRAALSNTFGFGGHNACMIAKKYQP